MREREPGVQRRVEGYFVGHWRSCRWRLGWKRCTTRRDGGNFLRGWRKALIFSIRRHGWNCTSADGGEHGGSRFERSPDRSIAIDIYALWAKTHMAHYGTTARQIASAAAKNHTNSVGNPRAQYRFPMDADAVLADRMVSEPLTRAMCAPIGDGAAAALLCSADFLRGAAGRSAERAVKIRGHAVAGGLFYATWEDERAPVRAAKRAFQMAGMKPSDIDLAKCMTRLRSRKFT